MRIFLVSNNLLLENFRYEQINNLELVRMLRPLSINGEEVASQISKLDIFKNVSKIYSSYFSSALSTAKYFQKSLDREIIMDMNLNDCQVGNLNNKNIKLVKDMQEHDFNYKLPNGESLNDVGNRINEFIKRLNAEEIVLFTHRRAILGFLLKYANVDYNLDNNLILDYNNEVIYDDSDNAYDIYEINYNNGIKSIKKL